MLKVCERSFKISQSYLNIFKMFFLLHRIAASKRYLKSEHKLQLNNQMQKKKKTL